MSKTPCWQKMKKNKIAEVESLLQSQERWCMNACSRYMTRNKKKDNVWLLQNSAGDISGLIVHSKQNLLPVLCGEEDIPPPNFLKGFFNPVPIHSLQGRKEDVLVMKTALEKIGFHATEKIDYDLMSINHAPSYYLDNCPVNIVIRKPRATDMDALAALHAAYEQEEVLPSATEFNAVVSRLNIERIFSKEQMLVAELNGRLIGKINTNAVTFTRFQIGGVYVHPDFRNLGIAHRMAGEFTASLIAQGRSISLFVKKDNIAAHNVYRCIGFEIFGEYQISYF